MIPAAVAAGGRELSARVEVTARRGCLAADRERQHSGAHEVGEATPGRFQPGAIKAARQHRKAIAPPGTYGIGRSIRPRSGIPPRRICRGRDAAQAIVGAVIVPARTSLPALTARRSSCAWRLPGCDLPLPGAVPVRYVRRPARPRRRPAGATAACHRRRVHTRHMGRIIGTVLGAILAVWLAVTAAGGIFASLKTFLVIGLIAMAVFIVVWLVARRPHRG